MRAAISFAPYSTLYFVVCTPPLPVRLPPLPLSAEGLPDNTSANRGAMIPRPLAVSFTLVEAVAIEPKGAAVSLAAYVAWKPVAARYAGQSNRWGQTREFRKETPWQRKLHPN